VGGCCENYIEPSDSIREWECLGHLSYYQFLCGVNLVSEDTIEKRKRLIYIFDFICISFLHLISIIFYINNILIQM
jgi:hypothetical protein